MDLDELQRVRDAERSKDSLQELRDSFYADVADHLAELKDQRDRAAERSENPFGDPEIQQLTSEIDATEQVVESIYERRVGKLVKLASFAAADMPADENGLTREERKLFTDLVSRIKENRAHVLDVLAGEHVPEPTDPTDVESTSTGAEPESTDEPTEPADPSTPASVGSKANDGSETTVDEPRVSAADLMGEGPSEPLPGDGSADEDAQPPAHESEPEPDPNSTADIEAPPSSAASEETAQDGIERVTLRITRDVGEIVGVDDREYELASEDVVTLPEANAGALLQRDAAERLD